MGRVQGQTLTPDSPCLTRRRPCVIWLLLWLPRGSSHSRLPEQIQKDGNAGLFTCKMCPLHIKGNAVLTSF